MSGPKPKYKPYEYNELIDSAYEGNIQVIDMYTRQQLPLLHRCLVCKTEWRATPGKLLTPKGAKKATFGCPNCCKGIPTNIKISKDLFLNLLAERSRTEHQPELLITGEYRGTNIHVFTECLSCGKTDKVRPSRLLKKKYLCTCINPRSTDKIDQKESKRLGYLYNKAFLTVTQLSQLTGYNTALLWSVGKRDNWINTKTNQFKASRYARKQRFVSGEDSERKQMYRRTARNITNVVYNNYKHIIDPDGLRGPEHSLDHMLSLHDAYMLGPTDLRYVCHPANLQILTRTRNLEKRTDSHGIETLKNRIKEFEKVHGKVKFLPGYKYRYDRDKVILNGETGIRVLGFDPGTLNFGCFAGLLLGDANLRTVEALESSMLVNPLVSIDSMYSDVRRYAAEIRSYIDEYKPHIIVAERFMSRGLKGSTIELVNMMLGILINIVCDYSDKGKPIYLRFIMPATWKNQVNRVIELNKLYTVCRSRGIADHKLDSALMSMYYFPTQENPYSFLDDKYTRNVFLNSLINVQ